MITKKPVKGMIDVTPKFAVLRREVQNKIVETFTKNGFLEIGTPSLDNINLFTSKEGGDNEKIMFKVLKRGDKLDIENSKTELDLVDYGLRFDLTLPLSRFYANNVNELPSPFKCFQIGNVWRGERPQRGRFRQFVQCDVDILGDDSITSEITLIKTVMDALNNVGFSNTVLYINNRILINELLVKNGFDNECIDVMIILDKLDKISMEKALKEVSDKGLSVSNFENLCHDINTLKSIDIENLSTTFESEIINDFMTVIDTLKKANYNVVYDPTLIRGMGYYTGTVFEIKDDDLGLSIAGGGRYDKLIGKLTNLDVPACGFSIGFERICLLLENKQDGLGDNVGSVAILVDSAHINQYSKILDYISKLQGEGLIVSAISRKKNVKKQIKDLEQLGYSKFINSSEIID